MRVVVKCCFNDIIMYTEFNFFYLNSGITNNKCEGKKPKHFICV